MFSNSQQLLPREDHGSENSDFYSSYIELTIINNKCLFIAKIIQYTFTTQLDRMLSSRVKYSASHLLGVPFYNQLSIARLICLTHKVGAVINLGDGKGLFGFSKRPLPTSSWMKQVKLVRMTHSLVDMGKERVFTIK